MGWNSLLALLLAFAVSGQRAAAEAGPAPGDRKAWFVAASTIDSLDNPLVLMTQGGELTEISLSRRMVGAPLRIPDDGRIRIVRKVQHPDDPEAQVYETLATVAVANDIQSALVFLVPDSDREFEATQQDEAATEDDRDEVGNDRPRFETFVQDLADFSGGDFMFLNFTGLRLEVRLGDRSMEIAAGGRAISKAAQPDEVTSQAISYHYFDEEREDWRLIGASGVVQLPSRREICVFSRKGHSQRINFHGITFPVTR